MSNDICKHCDQQSDELSTFNIVNFDASYHVCRHCTEHLQNQLLELEPVSFPCFGYYSGVLFFYPNLYELLLSPNQYQLYGYFNGPMLPQDISIYGIVELAQQQLETQKVGELYVVWIGNIKHKFYIEFESVDDALRQYRTYIDGTVLEDEPFIICQNINSIEQVWDKFIIVPSLEELNDQMETSPMLWLPTDEFLMDKRIRVQKILQYYSDIQMRLVNISSAISNV